MTDKTYHFIAGLPRSGSTLLSAILNQNPRFRAGMTSPVSSLTGALRTMMSQNSEIATQISDEDRVRILRGVVEGYHSRHSQPVIFDTSRDWTARIPELMALFQDVRLIAMVRDPAWIFDSIETILRKNPMRQSSIVRPGATITARMENMISADGMIGRALANLQEGVYGRFGHQILLVEYDALCRDPGETMKAIYDFIGEPKFDHDFGHVEYQQEAFDAALNTPDLHTVKGPVLAPSRQTILPPPVFARLSEQAFWRREVPDHIARVVVMPEPVTDPLSVSR